MKFWIILLGLLGIVGLFGFIILSNLHNGEALTASQKQQALINLLGRQPVLIPADHTTWKLYKGSVVSFQYPAWADIYTKDNYVAKKLPNILDSFHFTLAAQHIEGLVSVAKRSSFTTVQDDPGVQLRIQDSLYEKVGSTSAMSAEFFNATNVEHSYFLLKNGNIYGVVIIGGGDSDNETIFEKIKNSLDYK